MKKLLAVLALAILIKDAMQKIQIKIMTKPKNQKREDIKIYHRCYLYHH